MESEVCQDTAFEAVHRRGARGNVHELWAALEALADVAPKLIVQIGGEPGLLWAWWMLGADVIGVNPSAGPAGGAFHGDAPASVITLDGHLQDRATMLRLTDQMAGRLADAVVLAAAGDESQCAHDFVAFGSLTRDGGVVLLRGIADPAHPGIGHFWAGLTEPGRRELIGQSDPVGFGLVEIHGRDRQGHG